ncbi:hypothetical protein ColTof3_12638 [Colletotrichum tofieldiae]|nr:hypothetical protein ColTof3_12638 [Colletotrichum tofieldiae]
MPALQPGLLRTPVITVTTTASKTAPPRHQVTSRKVRLDMSLVVAEGRMSSEPTPQGWAGDPAQPPGIEKAAHCRLGPHGNSEAGEDGNQDGGVEQGQQEVSPILVAQRTWPLARIWEGNREHGAGAGRCDGDQGCEIAPVVAFSAGRQVVREIHLGCWCFAAGTSPGARGGIPVWGCYRLGAAAAGMLVEGTASWWLLCGKEREITAAV